MIVCIPWQVGGVLIRLSNDPLNSLSCALAIFLIAYFWVVNNLFPSVESPWNVTPKDIIECKEA